MIPTAACFTLVLALASCGGHSPAEPEAAVASAQQDSDEASSPTVELRLDRAFAHAELKIKWVELEDSRCPIGVNCIWAGQLVATFEVAREGGDPERIELITPVGRDPQPAEALGYRFRLLDVEPHPKEGVTIERGDYLATVEILSSQ